MKITLFARPRRFGKTINMSMVGAFLERGGEDRTELFADTFAWNLDGGRLRTHFQRYPMISLTFKDIKRTPWADAWVEVRGALIAEVERLLARGDLDPAFARFLTRSAEGPTAVTQLVGAMLRGDEVELAERLERLLVGAMSCHDLGREPVEVDVETIWQAFFVGLLVHLERTHRVTSNREAGFGCADILVMPRPPGPGAVLELKVVSRRETPEQALERAVAQLQDKDYAAEVRAAGATEVHQYAVVFDGERAWLRTV